MERELEQYPLENTTTQTMEFNTRYCRPCWEQDNEKALMWQFIFHPIRNLMGVRCERCGYKEIVNTTKYLPDDGI